jgi:hypothetical protein
MPLLIPHRHLPVVEQPLQLVLQMARFLSHPLTQNVHLVLQLTPLAPHPLHLRIPRISHLGPQLATGCAKQIRLVLHIRLADQAIARQLHVVSQNSAHCLHDRDGLVLREAGLCEVFD